MALNEHSSLSLSNGVQLPVLGLGTSKVNDPVQLRTALITALEAGYRHIDTAHLYGNEHIIGEVLEEFLNLGKLKLSEVFITTKLPFYAMTPAVADALIAEQLSSLRVEYIDLYLLHFPVAMRLTGDTAAFPKNVRAAALMETPAEELEPIDVSYIDTWRALEKRYKSGVLKSLGVSNFNVKQFQQLYDEAEIKPHNLQLECYLYMPQYETVELAKKLNVTFTSFATLGSPGRSEALPNIPWPEAHPMEEPLVRRLAEKYKKTSAQILLRQMLQRGVAIIPKSETPARIRENRDIFDFSLSDDEMAEFAKITTRIRLFEFRFCMKCKEYPFDELKASH